MMTCLAVLIVLTNVIDGQHTDLPHHIGTGLCRPNSVDRPVAKTYGYTSEAAIITECSIRHNKP